MAIRFDENFYLESKLEQLRDVGEPLDSVEQVAAAFAAAGLTAEAHYREYGAAEGVNPSPDFDTSLYLEQKLAQLQASGEEQYQTTDDVLAAFQEAGLSPLEHYNQYGAFEALSPNANFNVQAYLEDKLAQLQAAGETGYETTDDVLAAFKAAGLTPLEHYEQFGRDEGLIAKPVPGYSIPGAPSGLTEALADYQAAVAARTDFLNDNADNELLAAEIAKLNLAEGTEPTAEQMVKAIADAAKAAEDAVKAAETNLQAAIDDLDVARATRFEESVQNYDNSDLKTAVDALDSITPTTLMRDATLEAARAEAQAAVEADERIYAADGSVIVEADGTVNVSYTPLALVSGEYVEATGDAEVVGYVDFAVPSDATSNAASAEGVSTLNISSTAAGFTGSLALTFTPDGGVETTVVLTIENGVVTAGTTDAVTVDQAGTTITISGLTASAGTATAAYAYTAASLAETFTAAELQQAVVDADNALAAHEASKGDYATLLDAVRDAINAHLGANGANVNSGVDVDADGTPDSLLDLRDAIATIVDVADGQEVDQNAAEALVDAIAAAASPFPAPVAGAADTRTAQQKAIDTAFADIEKRIELEDAVDTAESSFNATVTGEVLNVILTLQEERQELIDAIAEAEGELTAAQELAAETQALVEQLEALDTNIEEALALLESPEEEGGFGVTLAEFADGSDATAESDLYVFADDEGSTITIANFGAEGEDRIYFGEGYTLVALGDASIQDRVGAVDQLEIFWTEAATGLTLYVEADPAAGFDRGTLALDDMTQITLTGVSADDIDFAGGFLTAGTVVEVA